MKKNFVILVLFLLFNLSFLVSSAQVQVIADGRLQTILERHVEYNQMTGTTLGFRVKVATFTGEGAKNKAFSLKNQLLTAFPEQRAYVTFDEPNFVVKIGDYTTRLDAYSTYSLLKRQSPTALIIQDYINPPIIDEMELSEPEYFEEDMENEKDFHVD